LGAEIVPLLEAKKSGVRGHDEAASFEFDLFGFILGEWFGFVSPAGSKRVRHGAGARSCILF